MIHYFVWVIFEQIIRLISNTSNNQTFLLDPIVGTFTIILGLFIIISLSNLFYNKIEIPFYLFHIVIISIKGASKTTALENVD